VIPDPDQVVSRALGEIDVPPHRDGFWEDLDAGLAGAAGPRRPGLGRGHWRLALVAAAVVAVLVLAAALARPRTSSIDVGRDDAPPAVTRTSPVPEGPVPPELVPVTTQIVTDLIGALARHDEPLARSLLGPRSLGFLASRPDEGDDLDIVGSRLAAWEAAEGRAVTPVWSSPRGGFDVVFVVVRGQLLRNGAPVPESLVVPLVRTVDGGWRAELLAAAGRPEGINLTLDRAFAASDAEITLSSTDEPPRWILGNPPGLAGVARVVVDGDSRLVQHTAAGALMGQDLGSFPPGEHLVLLMFTSDDDQYLAGRAVVVRSR
jgi:hypothetical protein